MKISNDPLPKFDWKALSSENEFVTLACVVRELRGLSTRPSRKTSHRAKNALRAIESGYVKVIPGGDTGESDYALLQFVRDESNNRLLATLDGALLSTLEKNKLGFLTLSSNKALFRRPKQQRI